MVSLIGSQFLHISYAQYTNDAASSVEEALKSTIEKIKNLKINNTSSDLISNDGVRVKADTQRDQNVSYISPGLGIKIQYPHKWQIAVSNDLEGCSIDNYCWFWIWGPIDYYLQPSIEFLSYSLDRSTYFFPACNCDKLSDFVRSDYKHDATNKRKTYVNDNITTIGKNHPAWQMETFERKSSQNYTDWRRVTGKDLIIERSLSLWTVDKGIGYRIVYYAEQNLFSKYLPDFLKIVRSISFNSEPDNLTPSNSTISLEEKPLPKPNGKEPSFLP
jgi:hypothetical protein